MPTREELILDSMYEAGDQGGRYISGAGKATLDRLWEATKREILTNIKPTFAIKDVVFSNEITTRGLEDGRIWIFEPVDLIEWLPPLPTKFSSEGGRKIVAVREGDARYIYDCNDWDSFPDVFVRAVRYGFCKKICTDNKIEYFSTQADLAMRSLIAYISEEKNVRVLR